MSQHWKSRLIRVTCWAVILAVSGCSDTPDQSGELRGKLTVTGSSTVAPLASEMAKRFEKLHPGVRVDVQSGGSGKGIADTRNGIADIGMASRNLKGNETDLLAHQIAADGVSLIVNRSNPITELTRQQVIDIYVGRVSNWKQLGGSDSEIVVVHKAEGRATLEVFLKHFALENPDIRADVIVGDNQHGLKTVSGVAGAIGYVSIGTAEASLKSNEPIRLLPVDGIPATSETVATGKFPISRPLILVTASSPSGLAAAFIEFCQSEEVHDLVVSQYFVPVQD